MQILRSGSDPWPDDGEIPHFDFYILARDWGWTWGDYLAAPPLVMDYLALYRQVETGVRQMLQAEAEARAQAARTMG